MTGQVDEDLKNILNDGWLENYEKEYFATRLPITLSSDSKIPLYREDKFFEELNKNREEIIRDGTTSKGEKISITFHCRDTKDIKYSYTAVISSRMAVFSTFLTNFEKATKKFDGKDTLDINIENYSLTGEELKTNVNKYFNSVKSRLTFLEYGGLKRHHLLADLNHNLLITLLYTNDLIHNIGDKLLDCFFMKSTDVNFNGEEYLFDFMNRFKQGLKTVIDYDIFNSNLKRFKESVALYFERHYYWKIREELEREMEILAKGSWPSNSEGKKETGYDTPSFIIADMLIDTDFLKRATINNNFPLSLFKIPDRCSEFYTDLYLEITIKRGNFSQKIVSFCTNTPHIAKEIWDNTDREDLLRYMMTPVKRFSRLLKLEFEEILPYIESLSKDEVVEIDEITGLSGVSTSSKPSNDGILTRIRREMDDYRSNVIPGMIGGTSHNEYKERLEMFKNRLEERRNQLIVAANKKKQKEAVKPPPNPKWFTK